MAEIDDLTQAYGGQRCMSCNILLTYFHDARMNLWLRNPDGTRHLCGWRETEERDRA